MGIHDTGVPDAYRILSIDPGSNKMGIAIIEVCPTTLHPTLVYATTFEVIKLINNYDQCVAVHGEKIAKMVAIQKALGKMLLAWMPEMIVSESPYMGRFPAAFAALVECLNAIRLAIQKFNPALPLFTIDPASVKKSVGVGGKNGDKDAMKRAVLALNDLSVDSEVNIQLLDEHAIDAIAVGYARHKQVFTKVG